MNCYNCGKPITDLNRTEEHVINNSLGGHLTSDDILCDGCNNFFGHSLDKEIDGQIGMFADLLGAKRHRENKYRRIRIKMISDKGEIKIVGRKIRPLHELLLDTGKKTIKLFETEEKYEALKSEKKKELSRNSKVEDNEYIRPTDKTKWHVKNIKSDAQGNIAFGGYDYFRGLARICLNFYLSKGHNLKYAEKVLAFVQGKIKFNDLMYYYFPVNYQIHELKKDEVLHIIHVDGDPVKKLLYAYLELFNFQNVLLIFDNNYQGPEIRDTYVYDLVNGAEIEKQITLRVLRHHVEIMHLIEPSFDREHLARYNRFQQIIERNQLIGD